MAGHNQSLLYHSVCIYDGTIASTKNVPYRIGNQTTMITVQVERYYDTWNDFHMIPTERPVVALPGPVIKMVTIPGKKIPIDFTTFLTGHPTFSNRTGSWSFYTENDWVNSHGGWIAYDKMLRNLFHGHISKVVLRDDPSYFYAGELSMGQWQTGADRSSVTISYNFYPYKKSVTSSMDIWEFDDFDFKDGVIQYLKDMDVNGSRIVSVYGSPERISPHISGSSSMELQKQSGGNWISYGNISTNALSDQSAVVPRFVIDDEINTLRFVGNGSVTVDYRRGLL